MSEDTRTGIFEMLEGVEGISVSDGLHYCGDSGSLLKFMSTFYRGIDDKAKAIEEAYTNVDLETYTIKVHSLKSTSRMIGAKELSELALSLEKAGHDGNKAYIDEKTKPLLAMYRSYKEKLCFVEDTDNVLIQMKKPISQSDFLEKIEVLCEAVENMDYDAAESILDDLGEKELSPGDSERIEQLNRYLKEFDWDSMERMLKGGD